jgi:hypothetical protein
MRTSSHRRDIGRLVGRLGSALLIAGALTTGGCVYAEAGVGFGPPMPIATVHVQTGWAYAQIGGVWYYVPERYVVYENGRGHSRGRAYWRGHRRPAEGYMLRGSVWVIIR